MKILFLSCNTGEGHNAAAHALVDYFGRRGITCETLNALKFYPSIVSSLVSEGHTFVYRKFPKLFGLGYRYEEKHSTRMLVKLLGEGTNALYKYISEHDYDILICVHAFSAIMVSEMRRRYHTQMPQYFVATDYTCSPTVNETEMDAYFIPRHTRDEFIAAGLPREKLVETGIPVLECFSRPRNRKAAREALRVPENCRMLLLMCGSLGSGPIEALVDELAQSMSEDMRLQVVCGSNKKLLDTLNAKKLPPQINLLGFTQQMPLLMEAADLFLSKPGGLSSTEAMSRRLPMICINAVPGCETRNLEHFLKQGYAVTAPTVQELAQLSLDYLAHPEKTEHMLEAINQDFSTLAVENIFQYIMCRNTILAEEGQLS